VTVKILLFASIVLVAISMAATWAHLLEMSAKLTLSRGEYSTVQQIYRGWAWLGIFIFAALASTSALAVLTRADRLSTFAAAASAACIVLALVVFFSYTFPANQATANWTSIPDHWSALRRQWEYAHAAEALLYFAALLFLAAAAVIRRT
jgi:DMSO reductase anchor subunit